VLLDTWVIEQRFSRIIRSGKNTLVGYNSVNTPVAFTTHHEFTHAHISKLKTLAKGFLTMNCAWNQVVFGEEDALAEAKLTGLDIPLRKGFMLGLASHCM